MTRIGDAEQFDLPTRGCEDLPYLHGHRVFFHDDGGVTISRYARGGEYARVSLMREDFDRIVSVRRSA